MKKQIFLFMLLTLLPISMANGKDYENPNHIDVQLDKDSYHSNDIVKVSIYNPSEENVWVKKECSSVVSFILKKNGNSWEKINAFPTEDCNDGSEKIKKGKVFQQKLSFSWFTYNFLSLENGVYKFQINYVLSKPKSGFVQVFYTIYSQEFTVEE